MTELFNESFEYKKLLYTFVVNNVKQVNLYAHYCNVYKKNVDILKVFNNAYYIYVHFMFIILQLIE